MTREQIRAEIKARLNSFRDLRAEQRQIFQELQVLEELMSGPQATTMDGMPRSPGVSSPVERIVIKHVTLEERYRAQLDRLTAAQLEIEKLIEGLEPTERRLARFRYIDALTWEDVCENMNYSWRQTHRIHAKMLEKLVDQELERRHT